MSFSYSSWKSSFRVEPTSTPKTCWRWRLFTGRLSTDTTVWPRRSSSTEPTCTLAANSTRRRSTSQLTSSTQTWCCCCRWEKLPEGKNLLPQQDCSGSLQRFQQKCDLCWKQLKKFVNSQNESKHRARKEESHSSVYLRRVKSFRDRAAAKPLVSFDKIILVCM